MASLITICPLKFFFFSCELNKKEKREKRKKSFMCHIEIVCFLSSWLGVGRGRQIAKSSLSVLLIPSLAEQRGVRRDGYKRGAGVFERFHCKQGQQSPCRGAWALD